jgi:DNA-binding response OmpR family regulator
LHPVGSTAIDTAPILIIDDELDILQFVQFALEDEGLPVVTAAAGREALDLAATCRPALVVLDMTLPGLNGEEVAAELHALYGDSIPILVMTADTRAKERANRAGAFAFLKKPFDLDELLAFVHRGLASASL